MDNNLKEDKRVLENYTRVYVTSLEIGKVYVARLWIKHIAFSSWVGKFHINILTLFKNHEEYKEKKVCFNMQLNRFIEIIGNEYWRNHINNPVKSIMELEFSIKQDFVKGKRIINFVIVNMELK